MRPEQRLSMSEQAAAVRHRDITCPACMVDAFVATTTWWKTTKNGGTIMRRARKCRACGYADNEDVPPPVRDRDNPEYIRTANTGNSARSHIEETDLT